MTRTALAAALATLVAGTASPLASADGTLTVYSGDFDAVSQSEGRPGGPGFALVERRVGFPMVAGDTTASLTGLPRALDAGSVTLKPVANARVRGQRFDFATAGHEELLRRAVGQTVTVEQSVGNESKVHTGTLVSAGDGLTLRLADGRIRVFSNYSSFELPTLPAGVVDQPTLHWTLASDRAGRQEFDLAYATAGLAWRAEYHANLQGQGTSCRMALDGAAMVVNRSGADFNDVQLSLVAGEPQRAPSGGPEMMAMAAPRGKMVMADGAPQAQASGEYHAYRLPGRGSLPQGSVQRLPLVDPVAGIACERRYETQAAMGDWMPPHPIVDPNFGSSDGQAQPVVASLRFRNDKTAGLGVPLPAGRVRMFEGNDFLGEARLDHTAAGEEVALAMGEVFDLNAERSREDFRIDLDSRTMEERVSVTVRNAKPTAANVRVLERLPRWTDWEITTSSQPFQKRNAQVVSFDVSVPAGGEAKLTYTVRYRWTPEVKLP